MKPLEKLFKDLGKEVFWTGLSVVLTKITNNFIDALEGIFKEIPRAQLKLEEAKARQSQRTLDKLKNGPDFIGREEQIRAAQKALDEAELAQFDISATALGKMEADFRKNIPSLQESFPDPGYFDDMADDFTYPFEEMKGNVKELEKQIVPTGEDLLTLAKSTQQLGRQTAALVPVMKQASAGMEGMFSDFAARTGPALEKLFGGLLSGKGGSMKDLLGSLKDTAIKTLPLARLPLAA